MNTKPTMTAQYERHSILRQHVNESVAKSGSGAVLVSAAAVADLFTDLDALRAHLTALESALQGVDARVLAAVERYGATLTKENPDVQDD